MIESRVQWALETIEVHPTMWSHQWRGTPISILKEAIAQLDRDNDFLRGIAAKVMPCHYCGVDDMSKCPHGFPGCALADDLIIADERRQIERGLMAPLVSPESSSG